MRLFDVDFFNIPTPAPTYKYPIEWTLVHEPNLWTPGKKPIGPVKIDWEHPLTNGLKFFVFVYGDYAVELVTGQTASASSGGALKGYANGLAYDTVDATKRGFEFPYHPNFDLNSSDYSILTYANRTQNLTGDKGWIGFGAATPVDGHWAYGSTQGARSRNYVYNGSAWVGNNGELGQIDLNAPNPRIYGFSRRQSDNRFYHYSPLSKTFNTSTNNSASTNSAGSGALSVGYSQGQNGLGVAYFAVFGYDRELYLQEFISLDLHHYQFLIPAGVES